MKSSLRQMENFEESQMAQPESKRCMLCLTKKLSTAEYNGPNLLIKGLKHRPNEGIKLSTRYKVWRSIFDVIFDIR